MKARLRRSTDTLRLALLAATLTPSVFAGCGEMPGKAAPAGKQPQIQFMRAAYRPARFVLVDAPPGADVVGLWHVVFTQNADFGGGLFDDSYAEWHSDGTEIMNSGVHSPATGNFCMGAWTKTGPSTYALKHVALDYSLQPLGSTSPTVIVIIREQVTVDQAGNHLTGSFTADIYAPYSSAFPATPGAHIAQVGAGTIAGERITAN
ncbi:MAG TPA: hypothetical protein VGR73_03450 [Bryobacteraceae bacterium]|nr:hypothetical protein [Bryobacteraceae bacterium]